MLAPAGVSRPELARGLQERAARAQPAGHVAQAQGWRLRYAPGCAWWVGTVLPHGEARLGELPRRVGAAEEFYAGLGVIARFQICPGACPDGLDPFLAGRGYHRESPMSLQVASAARVLEQTPARSPAVRVDSRPGPAWLAVWHAVLGHGSGRGCERDMLARVGRPSGYASAMIGDEVVAVGRGVAEAGWAGVFGMATLPAARGQGAARGVLAALASWAVAHQAGQLYLQVERGNGPARQLYGRAGFSELCGYHYRTAG